MRVLFCLVLMADAIRSGDFNRCALVGRQFCLPTLAVNRLLTAQRLRDSGAVTACTVEGLQICRSSFAVNQLIRPGLLAGSSVVMFVDAPRGASTFFLC